MRSNEKYSIQNEKRILLINILKVYAREYLLLSLCSRLIFMLHDSYAYFTFYRIAATVPLCVRGGDHRPRLRSPSLPTSKGGHEPDTLVIINKE